jgi:DNA-binding NtrC family response regulator
MKPSSPTELYSEQDIFTTPTNLGEELQTGSQSCDRTTALLDEINSLAETNSVAETLELTARLLAVLKVETVPLRERSEDIPAFIDLFLREAAATVSKLSGRAACYQIESGAVEMMCAFDWVGNIRVLRNTVYELTSYVREGEPITMERVQNALARLSARAMRGRVSNTVRENGMVYSSFNGQGSTGEVTEILRHLAQEGDIILPVEVCILRRGETFKQWAARVKQLSIEATCRTDGTRTMREAADRLGVSHSSLKSHLYRARCAS